MQYELRQCKYDDLNLIFELKKLCLKWYIDTIYGWNDEIQFKKTNNELIRNIDSMKIIQVGERDIGVTTFFKRADFHQVGLTMIHPDYQSRGIGGRIIKDYIAQAKRDNKRIIIKTYKENSAQNLYKRLGFKVYNTDETHIYLEIGNCIIRQIDTDEYDKCSSIWDMKNSPFTDEFKQQIRNGDRLVFVCISDDEFIAEGNLVINCADSDYYIPGKRIYLSHMITKKEYRNKGFGSMMIDYLVKKAKEMGYSEIALGVNIDNCSAVRLYKSKGFTTVIKECEDKYGRFYKLLKPL